MPPATRVNDERRKAVFGGLRNLPPGLWGVPMLLVWVDRRGGMTTAIMGLARQATQAALETPRSAAAPVVRRLNDEAVGQPEAPSASGTLGR